jgi:beta-glucanase (GH16 family)
MRSGVHPLVADGIVGHGDCKKSVESLYLSISDADLLNAIDRMKFDAGETKTYAKNRTSKGKTEVSKVSPITQQEIQEADVRS